MPRGACPIWVRRVGFVMSAICPVYPKQQTFPDPVGTSHLCQQRTGDDFSEGVLRRAGGGQDGEDSNTPVPAPAAIESSSLIAPAPRATPP